MQAWNLVRVHLPDDRRDYFAAPDELWEIVLTLIAERKNREIDSTLTKLRVREMKSSTTDADAHALHKIADLRRLIEFPTVWYDEMNRLESDRHVQFLALGSEPQQFVSNAETTVPFGRSAMNAATRKGDGS